MKVKDLIAKLETFDPNLNVLVSSEDYLESVAEIDEFTLLYIDDDNDVFAVRDTEFQANALGIFGTI